MKGLVLITGGSRGIGAATSMRLIEEGYQVCINYKENKNAAERLVNQITQRGVRQCQYKQIYQLKKK